MHRSIDISPTELVNGHRLDDDQLGSNYRSCSLCRTKQNICKIVPNFVQDYSSNSSTSSSMMIIWSHIPDDIIFGFYFSFITESCHIEKAFTLRRFPRTSLAANEQINFPFALGGLTRSCLPNCLNSANSQPSSSSSSSMLLVKP